jgi:1-deoxy-D-xylulose-5-phosphate synthase
VTLLGHVLSPRDVRALPEHELPRLCAELREEIISICGPGGGTPRCLARRGGAHRRAPPSVPRARGRPGLRRRASGVRAQAAHRSGPRGCTPSARRAGSLRSSIPRRALRRLPAGHACTAVSVAPGMAQARRRTGDVRPRGGDRRRRSADRRADLRGAERRGRERASRWWWS